MGGTFYGSQNSAAGASPRDRAPCSGAAAATVAFSAKTVKSVAVPSLPAPTKKSRAPSALTASESGSAPAQPATGVGVGGVLSYCHYPG